MRGLLLEARDVLLQLVDRGLLVEHRVLERAHLRRRRGDLDRVLLPDGAQQLVVERARRVGHGRVYEVAQLFDLVLARAELGPQRLNFVLRPLEEVLLLVLVKLPSVDAFRGAG